MGHSSLALKRYDFFSARTYIYSSLFVLVSVILPSLFHFFGIAGQVFLPIYFLVLLSTLFFNWRLGLLVAIFSPLASFEISHMPALPILYFVIFKGAVLALAILALERILKSKPLLSVLFALATYQLLGFFAIYYFTHNLILAKADLAMGYPGLILQILLVLFLRHKRHGTQTNVGDSPKA